jgi:DNA polymerase-3 subunit beta
VTVIDPRTATESTVNGTASFRVTTDQSALLAGLKAVMPAIPTRPPVPVLSGVKLTADLAGLSITAFDYEVNLTHQAVGAGQGSVLVSARLLLDLVKDLAKGCEITMRMDGSRLIIDGDGVEYSLLSMPIDEYPASPLVDTDATAVLTPAAIAGLVDIAAFASRDDTLPVLCHVQMTLTKGGTIVGRTTDRYRLGESTFETVVADSRVLTLHRRTIELLPKVFGKVANVDLAFAVTGTEKHPVVRVQFRNGTTTLTVTSFDEADFPKVAALFPDRADTTVNVASADLSKGLKQVAKVLERNTPVRLDVRSGDVVLSASYGQDARARKPLAATLTGGTHVAAAYNPTFLADALKGIGGERVEIALVTSATGTEETPVVSTKPAVLSSPERPGFRVLLMPVRIAG